MKVNFPSASLTQRIISYQLTAEDHVRKDVGEGCPKS